MANIDKELNQIKNAVYGREVRGSIHDGIDKINKETEIATGKADEAHDVMESIINDGFDNAALEANFEQRLDDEINNLQPEWTQFKDQTNQQLAETDQARRYESMINRKEPDGLYITWTDDDGRVEVYERMKPLMLDYNIPMTSAIIPDRVFNSTSGNYLTPEQVKELSDLGMEFLSHTNSWDSSDRPADWTEERLDEDFRTSQQQVKQLGGNPRGLVLPYAENTPLIQKVARRYFDFVVGSGVSSIGGKVLYPGEIDNYYITRVTVEQNFEYVKQRLDEGFEKGVAWINLVSHIFTSWYSDEYCRQIIEYAQGLGYKFITNQEGVERFGNIAQFGDNKIGADNSINSDKLGRVQYRRRSDGVSHSTPITDFEQNTITFTDINTAGATEFPRGSAGTLYTYRISVAAYSFQIYIPSRDYKMYVRNWDVDNSDWTDWVVVGATCYLGTNAVGPDDSPFLRKLFEKETVTVINSQGNEGFPENKSGVLITRSFTEDSFPFQEYHIYQEDITYKRWYSRESNEWKEWVNNKETIVLEMNKVDASTSIDEYKLGVTYCPINSAGNREGLPGGKSGTLITHKPQPTSISFSFQEFKEYGSHDKYIRYVSAGEWMDWKKIVLEDV